MLVELRFEVDATSWLTVEVELDPLFSWALLGEDLEGNLSLGDVVALVSVGIVNMDLNIVVDETSIDNHVLSVPLGVLAAVLGNS